MPQMIDVRKVSVGPRYLVARVRVADDAPLYTDEDIEGAARVYELMPEIADHVCLGDAGETFRDAMPSTEVAHLLEHVTVELVARTGLAGAVSCGQTSVAEDTDGRTYDIRLDCPDDVLVVASLSSAAWILQWAFSGGGEPKPGIDPIVEGIASMVESLPAPADGSEPADVEGGDEPLADPEPAAAPDPDEGDEPGSAGVDDPGAAVEPEAGEVASDQGDSFDGQDAAGALPETDVPVPAPVTLDDAPMPRRRPRAQHPSAAPQAAPGEDVSDA